MQLVLEIISSKYPLSGGSNRFVFDSHGGSIGRGQNNDCVLNDPDRFISSHHADIHFQSGEYLLTDTSVNGVFLNDSDQPVGKNTVRLHDGDRLVMGEYEFRVLIEPAANRDRLSESGIGGEFHKPGSAVSPWDQADITERGVDILDGSAAQADIPSLTGRNEEEPFRPSAPQVATEPDHTPVERQHFAPPSFHEESAPSDWDLTTSRPPSANETKPPPDWDHTYITPPQASEEGLQPGQTAAGETPARSDEAGSQPEWDRTDLIHPAAAGKQRPQGCESGGDIPSAQDRAHQQATSSSTARGHIHAPQQPTPAPPGLQDSHLNAMQAFFDAAGMNAAEITPDDALVFMRLFGGLYREIVQGLMEVLMARSSLKNEFRMRHTQISSRENNPLKFSGRVEDALEHLVPSRSSGFLDPEAAFKEAFQDIKDHQIAMVVGMRAAFESLLRRFDPEQVERRVIKGRKVGNLLPVNRKARCWECYEEWFAEISAAAEDDFQRLFGDEFTRAYEDQVARLALLRKKRDK